MIEFTIKGRKVTSADFGDKLMKALLEEALSAYGEQLHGKASSIVDPRTGKHAPVFVRTIGQSGWTISTSGGVAVARAIEKRLGLNSGEVRGVNEPANQKRTVYLAHASENKNLAEPIARGLRVRGIEVWFDQWEIGYGDSLRRKMEQGLGECTHFVVLLTPVSAKKPWVNEEIDAGLMRAVEGTARFIGLRHELPLSAISPFLRTRLTPEFDGTEAGLEELAAQIYGVSRKPPLGDVPRYVQVHTLGSTWSAAALAVAEYFVRKSNHGLANEPDSSYEQIQEETQLPMADVRIGILDLESAGLLTKRDYTGRRSVNPKSDLFVAFDAHFMPWDPEKDARDLAVHLFNLEASTTKVSEVAKALGWEPRRFNAASAYLVTARIVKAQEHFGGGSYWPQLYVMGDELLRFVRSL